jgi:hypothetical protein
MKSNGAAPSTGAGLFFDRSRIAEQSSAMEPDEAKRSRDAIDIAKRQAVFDSGVAWAICGAAWGFFLIALALGLFEELNRVALLGDWKFFAVIALIAVAAWVWWLPMRAARRRMRDRGP